MGHHGGVREVDFERLYAEHAAPLYAFLAYRTGDRTQAEDLLADTFERALRARRRFDPRKGSEKRWLYAIALNLVRDAARRGTTERIALEAVGMAAPRSHAPLDSIDQRDELAGALAAL